MGLRCLRFLLPLPPCIFRRALNEALALVEIEESRKVFQDAHSPNAPRNARSGITRPAIPLIAGIRSVRALTISLTSASRREPPPPHGRRRPGFRKRFLENPPCHTLMTPAGLTAPVAQRIEQRFSKPSVTGSNPVGSALKINMLQSTISGEPLLCRQFVGKGWLMCAR